MTSEVQLDTLARDVERFAALVGADANPSLIRHTLTTFAQGFASCPIELRTTSLSAAMPVRRASFRYIDPQGSHDPHQLARDAGLLAGCSEPLASLIPGLRARFPIFGFGVDASTSSGFEKLWPFFDRPYPVEDVAQLPALPDSVRLAVPMLVARGLTHVATIAADFRSATTNLYFPLRARARVASLLDAAGYAAPEPEAIEQLEHAGLVGVTFSWASEVIERMCFYVTVSAPAQPWLPDDPRLVQAARTAPLRSHARNFVVGGTYGLRGSYVKLELDYTGTSVPLLERWRARLVRKLETS